MRPTLPALPVPALDTERLTLRGHRLEDFEECAALWGDPQVTRYIGGRPFNREEVWARLLRYAGHWALLGYGYWVIRDRHDGRFVGEAGLADFHRDVVPSFDGAPELGWALAPWAHGAGRATEAVNAVLSWAVTRLPDARTVCMIDPANTASLRVAEKCGFRSAGPAVYRGEATLLFERR